MYNIFCLDDMLLTTYRYKRLHNHFDISPYIITSEKGRRNADEIINSKIPRKTLGK